MGSFAFIRVYDVSTWQPLWQYEGEGSSYAFGQLAFSPDGGVLYSTNGGTLRLLDAQTGQVLNTLYQGGQREIFGAMVLSSDGAVLVTVLTEFDASYNVVDVQMDFWGYRPAGAATEPETQPESVESPAQPTAPEGCTTTALQNANLRGGPGTSFDVVGSVAGGDSLTVVGQNVAADWYKLSVESVENAWIAGFLVNPPTCPAGFTLSEVD